MTYVNINTYTNSCSFLLTNFVGPLVISACYLRLRFATKPEVDDGEDGGRAQGGPGWHLPTLEIKIKKEKEGERKKEERKKGR